LSSLWFQPIASFGRRKWHRTAPESNERDLADVRQGFTILAVGAGVLAWIAASNMVVGLVVFIVALVIIESLLLLPDILRRHRLRACGYDELHGMSGEEFEEYLRALFKAKGYRATLTPNGTDFGVDLIIEREKKRTVVQAKHWVNRDTGVGAVQEVHAARAYYKADHAMVVTVGAFTQQAIDLAKSCKAEKTAGDSDRWYATLVYPKVCCYRTAKDLAHEPDGSNVIYISSQDPGHPNWIDIGGLQEGQFSYRYMLADSNPRPTVEIVNT
jgi:restriction system protein